jgi:hypothetical protein
VAKMDFMKAPDCEFCSSRAIKLSLRCFTVNEQD